MSHVPHLAPHPKENKHDKPMSRMQLKPDYPLFLKLSTDKTVGGGKPAYVKLVEPELQIGP